MNLLQIKRKQDLQLALMSATENFSAMQRLEGRAIEEPHSQYKMDLMKACKALNGSVIGEIRKALKVVNSTLDEIKSNADLDGEKHIFEWTGLAFGAAEKFVEQVKPVARVRNVMEHHHEAGLKPAKGKGDGNRVLKESAHQHDDGKFSVTETSLIITDGGHLAGPLIVEQIVTAAREALDSMTPITIEESRALRSAEAIAQREGKK